MLRTSAQNKAIRASTEAQHDVLGPAGEFVDLVDLTGTEAGPIHPGS